MRLENITPFNSELHFSLDLQGRETVAVVVKATYDYPEHGSEPQTAGEQVPLITADVFGADPEKDAPVLENDFAPMKPKCDVLCDGPAVAPQGRPATMLNVGIRIGNWSKALRVTGPRIWIRSPTGHMISDPRPFVEQPIGYDHAWGGVDPDPGVKGHAKTCEENPCGLGFYPYRADLNGAALPITSELGEEIRDTGGPHRPMALGPVGRSWLPRRRYAGTYDQHWMDHRVPLLPEDFDHRYFQAAPADQQIPYPAGGEPVELVNLTREGRLIMRLPRELISVTFLRKVGPLTQKVPLLDTVVFHSARRQLCLTWRTRFTCNRDMHELREIIVRRGSAA